MRKLFILLLVLINVNIIQAEEVSIGDRKYGLVCDVWGWIGHPGELKETYEGKAYFNAHNPDNAQEGFAIIHKQNSKKKIKIKIYREAYEKEYAYVGAYSGYDDHGNEYTLKTYYTNNFKKEIVKQQEAVEPQPIPADPAPLQSQTQAKTAAPSGYSSAISVDTARFPYAYYTNQIVRKINRYWQWSNEFGKLRAIIFFKISRDGSINSETIKDSSGNSLFDDQALHAVTVASPFPPLPPEYPDNDLEVYFEFTFKE